MTEPPRPSDPWGSPHDPAGGPPGAGAPPPYGSPPPGSPPAGPPPAGPPPYGPAGQPADDHPRRRTLGRLGTLGAGGAAVAGKAGLLGKLLLAVKGVAILAKLKAFLWLFVSIGSYALFWGWRFAVGFVALMFVHELGHVVALKSQGLKVSAPMFIPFLGAYTKAEGRELSVEEHAWSALAGPVAGALGAMAVLQLADLNESLLLRAIAYTAFLLNLVNLVPFPPLDGGSVAGALHPGVWWAGIVIMVGLLLWRPSPVWFLVAILGGIALYRRVRERRSGTLSGYLTVDPTMRVAIGACYLGLAALCLYGMHVSYVANPR